MIMGYLKAEKMAAEFIAKESENAGWRSWLPGMIKYSLVKAPQKEANTDSDSFNDADFDKVMQNYQELDAEEHDVTEEEETKSIISGTQEST
jgi:hypothetical protein